MTIWQNKLYVRFKKIFMWEGKNYSHITI
jgi:hypothetical protein